MNSATCRLCRCAGDKLFLKSAEKCQGSKCTLTRRKSSPGQHGIVARDGMRNTGSSYAKQLRSMQRIKREYLLNRKALKLAFARAIKVRNGDAGTNLLQSLETRLDNLVYRMGFASSRAEAKQLISHKGVTVNGNVVNISSFRVKIGSVVGVTSKASQQLRVKSSLESAQKLGYPDWLEVNASSFEGKFNSVPTRDELPQSLREIVKDLVEFFSRYL